MPPTILESEYNTFPQESYLVTMKCIDPVWYSMQQESKIGVFSRSKYQTISDCVDYILTQHNARAKHIQKTTVSFNWLQSNMTDYEFIRSVLAYCNPPGCHFYCNNEEGFFKPIGTGSGENGIRGNASAGSIVIDIRGKQIDNLVSIVNKQFLEKVSDGAVIVPYGEGLNDSDHLHREANPLGGNSSSGAGEKRYIKFSIDNPAIKAAFSANVAFRTRMFGRVAKMRTDLMTNSNPLQTISITNNSPDIYPSFVSSNYYIVSVKNVIGWNITWPETPHCWLVVARGGA